MTDPSSLSNLSREERALLFERLREKKKRTGAPEGRIPRRAPELDPVPLSFAQERLWLLDRLMPGTVAYNIVLALSIEGTLVPAALGGALRELARRHEALRTTYGERQGRGVQIIAPPSSVASRREMRMVDLGGLPAAARDAEAWRLAAGEAGRPFDLQRGPVMRSTLLRLGVTSHMLLLEVHHIATDGWSMGVMTREIPTLYSAAAAGRPSPLPEPAIQYADFGLWQRQWLSGEVLERQLGYWRGRLAGLPSLQLPTDRPRPAEPSFRGANLRYVIGPAGTRRAVRALARQLDASLFMILLAAFQVLLERYTGQRDFAVGTPVANRNRAEVDKVIGCFVNSLVLRADLGGEPAFTELVGRARKTALEAFAHQDLPFDKLVEELRPERRLAHNPLYQVSVGVQNAPVESVEVKDLILEALESHAPASRFDLEASFWEEEDDDTLSVQLNYSTDLFDATTVRRLAGHLDVLLAGILEDPSRRLSALPLLTRHETHQVLREWNDTAAALPEAAPGAGATLVDLFREQAVRRPGAAAVSSAAEGDLSYAELDARSERLARRLSALGVGPELPVALVADRTHAMVVGVLAILKAGGAYMPLDPTYPAERLSWMLADSGALILLGEPALLETLPAGVWAPVVVELTADPEETAPTDPDAVPAGPLADALAYVMYTSGSTGQPKGVGVTHRNVVRLVRESGFADLGPEQVFLQLAPISFDAATLEIWGPLANGGRLALPPPGPLSLDEIGHAIESRGVTSLWLTAGLFHQMVEHRLEALRPLTQLLAGGDVLSPAHVERTLAGLPGLTLINGYGPTEGTTFTTCHPMTGAVLPPMGTSIPIGRPIGNSRALLLDRELRPVPMGVYGELYAAGGGVARGYRGRPDLTAERFVPNPFGQAGERMYRTGDLARFRPSGVVEFLGRRDGQVKLRGYRVELGEIEAALARHPEVREAAVALREDAERPGDRRLVAYVVPRIPSPPDGDQEAVELDTSLAATLRRFLGEELPEYMVPSAFVAMAVLPLSPNGKVDRAALPALPETLASGQAGDGAKRYVPPRTPVEIRIADLYAEVLRLERVGLEDDFFDVGGHSLLATQVVSRLRDTLGVELPLYRMFESPTVAGLARLVEDELSLLAAGAAAEVAPPIVPVPRDAGDSNLPLSFAQERLWVIDRLIPGSAAYNIALALSVEGALEPAALEAALREMVRRHETLRTTFGESHGKPVQSIAPPPSRWDLPLADLTALPPATRLPEARRLAEEEAGRPFDLERGPVLRTTLLRLDTAHHALLLDIHHIASDGWSMGVMTREIAPLYSAAAAGRPSPLPELAVQYADFAVWQRRWLAGDVLERQLAYWRDKLAGLPVLQLPTDRPRPAEPTFRGVTFSHSLGAALTREARSRARQQDATLFMVLLAAFQALLERYTDQRDFAVGAPIANRNRAEVEPLIGFFVNSLVLRGDLAGDPPFSGLVERTRKTALEAFSYQDLPFERLVEELRPERRLTHNPLFQVAFAVQNAPVDRIDLPGLSLAPLESSSLSSRFDLEVTFWEVEDELLAQITYSTDLLDEPTVRRLVGHLEALLLGAMENPARLLSRLPLFQEDEAHQILREWNDTERELPAATVVDLFREQADRRPGAVAVSAEEGDLSYADLDARSDRLARRLAGLGVSADMPVGILAERSHALVVGLLGILKAGGAYLPLDPNYPAERLAWMLADSGARVVLGDPGALASLPEEVRPAIVVELTADPEIPADTRGPDPAGILPGNLAYVMYTSGSTGRPKAVGVTHGNVVRLVREGGYARLGPDEVHLQFAPISFDASAFEIWAPLANGGRLVLAPPGRLSLDEMGRTIESQGVTTLLLTTGLFNQMVDHRLGSLRGVRQFLTGGEALSPVHGERALAGLPGVTLINVYGPTEVTVFISTHSMSRPEEMGTPVSIGRPMGNTRVAVLDGEMRPVPLGAIGELCAGGAGVARGYVGRPDLTAERFVPDPTGSFGERLYRTGDLARLRAGGLLEFLGRRDGQVKLRGFRVELGEIEAALARHPAIHEAAVTIREDRPGDRRLVAYVVPRSPGGEVPAGLREALAASLPEHMIPSAFVAMAALPLTSNGKVDRAALPASAAAAAPAGQAAAPAAYTPPETPLEVQLAGLYAEVLGVERVGRHDGFFDLGGHSLLATQVMSRLRDTLGVDLPLRRMFESSSVAELARAVEEGMVGGAPAMVLAALAIPRASRNEPLPLSFAQERLWFLDRLMSGGAAYSLPMALRLAGGLDVPALAATLTEIVRRHESLRTVFGIHPATGEPVQVVHPLEEAWRQALPLIDLSGPGLRAEEEARRLAIDEAGRPFDLERGPLLRTALVRLAARDHLLLANMHHIVSDGWSLGVMVRELEALYAAAREGRPSLPAALPELPVQYADFAVWQRRWLSGEVLERHLDYWRGRLAGAPPLDLPSDRPRAAVQSFRGAARRFGFGAGLSEGVGTLARRHGATPFMVLAAGLFALLARYSGQPDISLGSPIANRNRSETEGLIGFFVNTLVLRTDVGQAGSFVELLEQVREVTLGAYAHQDLPFEKLVGELHPERDPSRTPFFQVMLALQNAPLSAARLEDLEVIPQDLPGSTAKFDLSLSVGEEGGGALAGGVEYVTDLYDGSTALRLCRHWLRLLESAVHDPSGSPVVLSLLSTAERHQLLREWNDTVGAAGLPGGDVLLHQLFEARADAQPESLAAAWPGEAEPGSLTYGELEERANRIAGLLRRLGVGRGVPVGIWMERSLDMLAAVLGTLKAGANYLPIDTGWPSDRAEAVLGGSGAPVVLTRRSHLRRVRDLQWRLPLLDDAVCLDVETAELPAEPVDAAEVQALWDVVSERAVDWVTAAGFYSAYTGAPFSEAEVLEYRDRVLGLAAPYVKPGGRVLEIGSGSGLILWELAPRLGETGGYVGIDPSERTQQVNRERASREALPQVELITGFAHEIDRLAAGSFDLVILASTAQFFPGPVYLERVLERALGLLAPGGAVVVADVLDPRRREDFQRSLAEHAAAHPGGAAASRLAASGASGVGGTGAELYLDEGLFLDLRAALPDLGEVAIHHRPQGGEEFANELRFRYDVVLEKAAAPHPAGERRKRVWTGRHVAGCPAERPEAVASPVDLAYVIHTSGSTGQPKGIAVQHRPAVELARWVNRTFGVGPADRLLFITSLAFDLSVYDIFGVLGAGGVVHVATEQVLRDPQRLARMLVEEPVTIWDSAPAALQQLAPLFPAPAEAGAESRLRLVLLSGDWVPVPLPDQVRAAFPGARVIALGGATEATVWSNWFPVGEVDPAWPSIPYGRPIDGARYHVLDGEMEPCPIGVPGDLYIGGRCLCVGYARMPETTAERFLPDAFGLQPGERLYATGDRARYGRDGNLEFLGRVDQQVKVRGYRIELEEIEAVLARQPGVREAVVAVREDVAGDRRLVGYVVPARQPAPASQELRSSLQQSLPEYMVPWTFVVLESLPLTANGKVDRKALPPPVASAAPDGSGSGYTAPRNELERVIAAVWREVLGLAQVGVHDNLFELGGSSLVVVKLHGRLEQELGRKLPMMELFRHTTIDALARSLAGDAPSREGGTEQARARTQTRRESLAQLNEARARRRDRPE